MAVKNVQGITYHYIRYVKYGGETGIAVVPAKPGRRRPSWGDAGRVIPGFFRGEYIGPAPAPQD